MFEMLHIMLIELGLLNIKRIMNKIKSTNRNKYNQNRALEYKQQRAETPAIIHIVISLCF